jgi:molybdate transport system substrate-binding protein
MFQIAVKLIGAMLLALSIAAGAAEITVYSGGAAKTALAETAAGFERLTGHHVAAEYAPVGVLMGRLANGERADILLLSAEAILAAEAKGWVMPGTAIPLGAVGTGVAVREGAVLPDISTPEAFSRALLAAKSITYIDPAKGTSGKNFAEVLQRLGIAEAVRAKTRLADAGYVVEAVARGEIELGIQQITEILPVKGVTLVGPLPEALQKITVYSAAASPNPRDSLVVQAFLVYLRSPETRAVFVNKGFQAP